MSKHYIVQVDSTSKHLHIFIKGKQVIWIASDKVEKLELRYDLYKNGELIGCVDR